jgi:hypothetical protein
MDRLTFHYGRYANKLERPEGAVPADAFPATESYEGNRVAGVPEGGAWVGDESRRGCVPLLSSAIVSYWRHSKSRPHAGKAALLP